MKKLMIIIVILNIQLLGGYLLIDNLFPKAELINYPTIDNINQITILQNIYN